MKVYSLRFKGRRFLRAEPQSILPNEETILGNESTFSGLVETFLGSKSLIIMLNHCILGGRAYPVRHYPIRLRDRNQTPHQPTRLVGDPVSRAILCIALNPQSGDFSGAILGVRSVALLHVAVFVSKLTGNISLKISMFSV